MGLNSYVETYSYIEVHILKIRIWSPGPSVMLFEGAFPGISGKGNGTPLQYSCLENPMDGGA